MRQQPRNPRSVSGFVVGWNFARLVKGPSRDLARVESSVRFRHRALRKWKWGRRLTGRTRLLHSRYLGSNPSGSTGGRRKRGWRMEDGGWRDGSLAIFHPPSSILV